MKFSVIVPIYKVEPYLRQCVDSVLAQTYGDFELILVDDGSPDGCPAICDEYAVKDARVKVIHKSNGGIVSARQAGLQAAQGEYIAPVDGDDWVAPDFLEQAAHILNKYDVDMVCFGYTQMNINGRLNRRHDPVPEGFYDREKKEKELWPKLLMAPDGKSVLHYLWGKVYRKKLIEQNQLQVDLEIVLAEDAICQIMNYQAASTVYICHSPVYFYRRNDASITQSFSEKWMSSIVLVVRFLNKVEGIPKFEEQVDRYACIWYFVMVGKVTGQKQYCTILRDYLLQPEIRKQLRRVRFVKLPPRIYVTLFFLRHGWVNGAYAYWTVRKWLKKMGLKELLVRLHLYKGEEV